MEIFRDRDIIHMKDFYFVYHFAGDNRDNNDNNSNSNSGNGNRNDG